jgi:hypothetical protein
MYLLAWFYGFLYILTRHALPEVLTYKSPFCLDFPDTKKFIKQNCRGIYMLKSNYSL